MLEWSDKVKLVEVESDGLQSPHVSVAFDLNDNDRSLLRNCPTYQSDYKYS